MSDIVIRKIRREDVKDIIEIIKSATFDFPWGMYYNVHAFDEEEMWISFQGTKEFPTLVAEYNGKVIAFATNFPHWEEKNNFYIGLLLTHADYRGRGAGGKLIRACLKIAVEKKFDLLSLHTWASNRAMRLYRRTGFTWIPSSAVYMINFSPQLFKYKSIREIFKKPENLIDCLVEPPKKIDVNGHVAWKYLWYVNNNKIEAIFDNDSRLLLSLKINHDEIEIYPPEKNCYLKNTELELIINTTRPRSSHLEEKVTILNQGRNSIKIKAKEKIELKIDDYRFGFKLKVLDPLEVRVSPRHIIAPSRINLFLINNKDESIEDELLIIPIGHLIVNPDRLFIKLNPKDFSTRAIWVDGEGILKVIAKETKGVEKEIHVFKQNFIKVDDESFTSTYWRLSNEEVRPLMMERIHIWYDLRINDEEIKLKMDTKERKLKAKAADAIIEIDPTFNDNELIMNVSITAIEDLSGYLRMYYWIEVPSGDNFFILPTHENIIVRDKYVYPSFPKRYNVIRKKLPVPLFGYDFRNYRLLIEFDSDGYYTLRYGPYSVRIDFPVTLKRGETITKRIRYKIDNVSDKLLGVRLVRAVDAYLRDSQLVIKNNWATNLDVKVFVGDTTAEGKLSPLEELTVPLHLSGHGVLKVIISVNGYLEEREIPYVIPIKVRWQGKELKFGNIKLTIDEKGGSLRSLTINKEEILAWWDNEIKTPLGIPLTHGGFAVLLLIDGKDEEVYLKKWKHIGDGVVKLHINDMEITRRWDMLGNNSFVERIRIENKGHRPREIEVSHYIFFNSKLEEAVSGASKVRDHEVFSISDSRKLVVSIHDKTLGISLGATEYQEISVIQLSGFNGIIQSRWRWDLKPNEAKEGKLIVRYYERINRTT